MWTIPRSSRELDSGRPLPTDAEKRLRFTYQIVMTLMIKDSPAVAQAWLVGVKSELGDRVPIRLLRESNIDQMAGLIVGAARVFAAGGQGLPVLLCFWRRALAVRITVVSICTRLNSFTPTSSSTSLSWQLTQG